MTLKQKIQEAAESHSNLKYGNYSDTVINSFLAGSEKTLELLSEGGFDLNKFIADYLDSFGVAPSYADVEDKINQHYNTKIAKLKSQLNEAREIIKFYADIKSWEAPEEYANCMIIEDDICDQLSGGKKAREYLTKTEKEIL